MTERPLGGRGFETHTVLREEEDSREVLGRGVCGQAQLRRDWERGQQPEPCGRMSHGLRCTWQVHGHMSALHFMCLTGNGRSLESYLSPLAHQYDAVPIQSSVVLCSCPSPSMVRPQTESSAAPGVPSGGSRQGPTMDSTATEPRPSAASLQHTTQPPPQPRKKRPEDFKFGKILGEGSFSTVSTRCCCCCC